MVNFIKMLTDLIDSLSGFLVSFTESVVPAEIFDPAQEMVASTLIEIAPVWNEFWAVLGEFIF